MMLLGACPYRLTTIDHLKEDLHRTLDHLPTPENIDPVWFKALKGWVFVSIVKHHEDYLILMRCDVNHKFEEQYYNNPVFEPMVQEQTEIPDFEDEDELIQPIVSIPMFEKVLDILNINPTTTEGLMYDFHQMIYKIQILQTIVSTEEFVRAQKETNYKI